MPKYTVRIWLRKASFVEIQAEAENAEEAAKVAENKWFDELKNFPLEYESSWGFEQSLVLRKDSD